MTNRTISAGMIHWTLQGARAHCCDVDAILRRAGLPAAQLLGNGRYPRLRYSALLRTLTRTMRDEFWGQCSRPIAPGTFASACRSMILAADLREAIVVGLAEYGVRGAMEQPTDLSPWHHQWRSVPSMRASLSEKQRRSFASLAGARKSMPARVFLITLDEAQQPTPIT